MSSFGRQPPAQSQTSKLIGANEDMFLQAFDSTPKLNIATQKKLESELTRVITIISNTNTDWDQRVQAMKIFRSLVNSGIADQHQFYTVTLRNLEVPFQNNVCDLRSQVVRETCITIAFLSCRLQQKFSRMAENLLPSLIKLIPNSAKIVSTSALVAIRFIIQSTQSPKLISIIKYQLATSKSKEIHRALCEMAEKIATIWPPQLLERQVHDFIEVLRLGINDSDEQARQYARRAYNAFAEHFRELADRLYNSLDNQRQRMLNNLNHGGGSTLSMNDHPQTTTNNLNHHQPHQQTIPRPRATNLASNGNGSSIPVPPINNNTILQSRIRSPTTRSTSVIDVEAQRRARERNVYLKSIYHRPRQLGAVTPSPIKSSLPQPIHHSYQRQNVPTTPVNTTIFQTPQRWTTPVAASPAQQQHQQQQQQQQNQQYQQPAAPIPTTTSCQTPQKVTADKPASDALSKAASYLLSAIKDTTMDESQIVSTIKYFASLIEKHPSEMISQLISELMAPLVIGVDHTAISVRKQAVFAMVAIYAKVGLTEMEPYISCLMPTQKKLIEVYIKKYDDQNRKE